MKVVPATDARKRFQDVIDSVHYTKDAIAISKRGKPWVVIKPLDKNELEELVKKD